jgi:hypothetical protein
MATTLKYDTVSQQRGRDIAPEFYSRSRNVERSNKSAKVSGAFTTLSDGSRFRRATGYAISNHKIVPGGPQITKSHTTPGTNYLVKIGPGGWYPDYMFSNMTLKSTAGAQTTTYTYPVIGTSMRNEAVTKALLKIADQKVNLAENLATAGQTVRMFANASKSLADLLMNTYRDRSMRPYLTKSFRDLVRGGVSKSIANKYLEYVYGWKPLVQDVYALAMLAKKQTARSLLLHGEGKSSRAEYCTSPQSDLYTVDLGPLAGSAKVNCSVWAQVDPNWSGARALNQLGLINPLSLVWELTPWSFVVDWLLPIGSVLQAMSAPAGLIFIDGSISVRTSVRGPYKTLAQFEWYNIDLATPATGSLEIEGYYRETINSWPLPGLWIDPDPLRGDRIFKAAALAISNLSGARKSRLG